MTWWWLSFADESGFLGVCVVGRCPSIVDAVKTAHVFGCNPGGEVRGAPIPDEHMFTVITEAYLFRLLSKAEASELERLGYELERRHDA